MENFGDCITPIKTVTRFRLMHSANGTMVPAYLHDAVRGKPGTPVVVGRVRVEIYKELISLNTLGKGERSQEKASDTLQDNFGLQKLLAVHWSVCLFYSGIFEKLSIQHIPTDKIHAQNPIPKELAIGVLRRAS